MDERISHKSMAGEWRMALFAFAIVFFSILLFEIMTGNVISGSVDFRFIPDAPREISDASSALISSRELAGRLQAWIRDRTFIDEIRERSNAFLVSRSRFLPPVSAFMPAPDTVRMRVEAKSRGDIEQFVRVAEGMVRERAASYLIPGVRLETSSIQIKNASPIRLRTILGAFSLAALAAIIVKFLFVEKRAMGKSSWRP